jgi:hypothetical protein
VLGPVASGQVGDQLPGVKARIQHGGLQQLVEMGVQEVVIDI